MAKKPVTEVSDSELFGKLSDSKKELFNLRFQLATGQLENTARMPEVKKEIARINTEVRSREIAAAESIKGES